MFQRERGECYQGSPRPQGGSHSETLTWGALEAVSIVTWPALAGEGSLGVVAGDSGVAGARLDVKGTLVHVLNARRVPRRRLPPAVTDTLVPRLDERKRSRKPRHG